MTIKVENKVIVNTLKLPTTFTEPDKGLPDDFSMIVFGQPKVGKTTFGSEWPDSVLLECEPDGARYIKAKYMQINSLAEFREAYKLLKDDKTFKTVVIDSLDKIASWIEAEICVELGLNTMLDAKKGERFGTQWGEYKERVLGFLMGCSKLNKRIIILAHTKKAEMDGNGTVISPKTINIYGQTATQIISLTSNIGYMFAKDVEGGKTKRYLSFKSGELLEAGSRHPALSDKVIELPKGAAYKAFEACFNENTKSEKETK